MKYKRRTDHNQAMITRSLQWAGYHVTDMSLAGDGVPDLLCTRNGQCFLVEIKNKEGRGVRFTPAQEKYYREVKAPVFVVTDINEVESLIKGDLEPINRGKAGINSRNGRIKAQKASALDG
jgi:hypothetical protein